MPQNRPITLGVIVGNRDFLVKMAKLGIVLDEWMRTYDIDATAIQCWSSLQGADALCVPSGF